MDKMCNIIQIIDANLDGTVLDNNKHGFQYKEYFLILYTTIFFNIVK